MAFEAIDTQVENWASAHTLVLHTSQGDRAIRCVYVSSLDGECFQIWIEAPVDGQTCVYAACIEGRKDGDAPEGWPVAISEVTGALDVALETVVAWMAPSRRYYIERQN